MLDRRFQEIQGGSPRSGQHSRSGKSNDRMIPAHSRAAKRVAPRDEGFALGRFAILLALVIFAANPDVLLGLQTFYYRDFGFFAYPLAHYHRDRFWHGEIPLWNPLNNCGLP